MTVKLLTAASVIVGALGTSALGTGAIASPYCETLLHAEQLESRYARIAPIHNSRDTGWIFGNDQIDRRYGLSDREAALFSDLVEELDRLGTDLALWIAPPRPIIAGDTVVDATLAEGHSVDLAAQADAFRRLISQINDAGAVAPDLLSLALGSEDVRREFYFHRDTHWTNIGAAHSALALAEALEPGSHPAFQVDALPVVAVEPEAGSLAAIVRTVCDGPLEQEESPVFDYSGIATPGLGLLDDPSDQAPPAVLLGTSFSDRYRRDQYQAADALAAALNRPIVNRSVSGGGMVGPIETYFLDGTFSRDRPDLMIWEFPYNNALNEPALRRVLGAVRSLSSAHHSLQEVRLDDGSATIPSDGNQPTLLRISISGEPVNEVHVTVGFDERRPKTIRMRRNARMSEVAILEEWWVDLSRYSDEISEVTLDFRSAGGDRMVTVGRYSASTEN